MNGLFLLRGFVIGFAIAAPVGPVGILVVRRTLSHGRAIGFVSGLGAATADAVYGGVAAFGLTFISSLLVSQSDWIRLIGGAFLLYLGLTTLLSRPAERAVAAGVRGPASAYGSTAFLTLTNPATILSFAAVFAGLGVTPTRGSYPSAALLVLGVFLGSAFWWFLLSGGMSLVRSRLTPRGLTLVNRVSGVVLTLFGIGALASLAGWARRSLSA
jgi:threonine/homoserine/homoserine lactone efflux protein